MNKESDIIRQYRETKPRFPGVILFYRIGEFYEILEEDAEVAHQLLDIKLTQKCGLSMCGVPFHSCLKYIKILIRGNKKVAICDQIHAKKEQKSAILERKITRIFTPGTFIDDEDEFQTKHLISIFLHDDKEKISICWTDISVGYSYYKSCNIINLNNEIDCIEPCEIITNDIENLKKHISEQFHDLISDFACENIEKQENKAQAILMEYIKYTFRENVPILEEAEYFGKSKKYMHIDARSIRNLEIFSTYQGRSRGSLYHAINMTKTKMGGRLLRKYMHRPLCDIYQK